MYKEIPYRIFTFSFTSFAAAEEQNQQLQNINNALKKWLIGCEVQEAIY